MISRISESWSATRSRPWWSPRKPWMTRMVRVSGVTRTGSYVQYATLAAVKDHLGAVGAGLEPGAEQGGGGGRLGGHVFHSMSPS